MKLLFLILLASGILHAAKPAKFDWQEIKIGKVAYVPLKHVENFYGFGKLDINGKSIVLENRNLKLQLTEGSQETMMNGVKIFLSEPIRKQANVLYISQLDLVSLIDPVLRPAHLVGANPLKVVVLDAGHGGKDKGAGGQESKLTLSVVRLAKGMLENKGYEVVLTRSDDIEVPLEKRVAMANAEKDAVVISLHFNSGDKNAEGFETHIVSARVPNEHRELSMSLGVAIHSRSLLYLNNQQGKDFEIVDRGVRHSKFRLLMDCKHPTVLIEGGFLSNAKEAKKINNKAYQLNLASAIARSVDIFRASIRQKR